MKTILYDAHKNLIAEIEYCTHNRWYWLTWLNNGRKRVVHPKQFYGPNGEKEAIRFAEAYHNKIMYVKKDRANVYD